MKKKRTIIRLLNFIDRFNKKMKIEEPKKKYQLAGLNEEDKLKAYCELASKIEKLNNIYSIPVMTNFINQFFVLYEEDSLFQLLRWNLKLKIKSL